MKSNNFKTKNVSVFLSFSAILITGILLFAYTTYRAYTLSFTHDESFSWNLYVQMPFMDIISLVTPSANNHILNTLLMKLSGMLLGDSEIALRMPNLLAHACFLIFSFLISRKLSRPMLMFLSFIILNINPYLLDFFSLARGYGISLGLMMAGIYYFLEYIEKQKNKSLNTALLLTGISLIANLSLILFYISIIITANIFFLLRSKPLGVKRFLRFNIPFIISTLILSAILYEPVRKLIKFGQLYFGGDTGFWNDTVMSLLYSTLYRLPYTSNIIKPLSITTATTAVLTFLIFIFLHILRRHKISEKPVYVLTIVFILFITGSILQHLLFGTKYLWYRTALIYMPFFIYVPFFMFDYLSERKILYGVSLLISLALGIATIYNFSLAANKKYVLEWQYEANTKDMLSEIEKINKLSDSGKNVSLGISWVFEPSINFYRNAGYFKWLDSVDRGGVCRKFDYYYILPEHTDSLGADSLEVVKEFPVTGNKLLKHRD